MAYTLPPNLENGIYSVHLDSRGREIHKRVAVGDAAVNATGSLLLPRVLPAEVFCGCQYNLNPSDCDAAVSALKNQVPNPTTITSSYYSISGSVVVFACNITPQYVLDGPEITRALQGVTDICGLYIAGTYRLPVGQNSADIGYMIYTSGLDFCAHAEASAAHSC